MDFSSTLLREKFTLRDLHSDAAPLVAMSNRIALSLTDAHGKVIEKFVVRAQSMYTCLRMAARIVQTFDRLGPLMAREEAFDFQSAWDDIVRDYERTFNPQGWVSIYNGGKRIFSANDYHAFLDIIENCDFKNTAGNYDTSVFLAQEIFAAKGKNVTIDHDANTGMVLDIKKNRARCGLILRSPVRRTNFNYSVEPVSAAENPITAYQCLTAAAAFLEGIHLSFIIGRVNEQIRLEETPKYGEDQRKADAARRRLARINAELKVFENKLNVTYRPERPEFPHIIIEAEKYTRKTWEAAQAEQDVLLESE